MAVVPWPSWAGLIYLALVSQYFGFWLWNNALAIGGVARIGQVQLLQPFATLAIAAVLLGETIDLRMIAIRDGSDDRCRARTARTGRTSRRAGQSYCRTSHRRNGSGLTRGRDCTGPLGFLDRPRRHLHGCGGARS